MESQKTFLSNLCENNKDAIIVGSIGTISYDLNEIEHPNKILIRGAMGAALGCGLGIALAKPDQEVIVVIGDGAFLMKMGSVSTICEKNPENLTVHIINNDSYASCGGQKTYYSAGKENEGAVERIFIEHEIPATTLSR